MATAQLFKREDGKDWLVFTIHGIKQPVQIPVITSGSREKTGCWTWNGDLEKPTVMPSIRMQYYNDTEMVMYHYWLKDGVCISLNDCTDGNSGKNLPLETCNS